jgi:hypothetical protein
MPIGIKEHSIMTDLYFIAGEDKEWDFVWSHFPDKVMYNAQYGEVLQYMGSICRNGHFLHEFRHRAIPGTNERKYWKVPASPGWDPNARDKVMEEFFPDAKEFGKLMMI